MPDAAERPEDELPQRSRDLGERTDYAIADLDTFEAPAVPMLDLQAEITLLWDELNYALQRVLRSGQFVGGKEVEAFEAEAAAFLGVKHAIGLNSGTDALLLSLDALGVGPGDEVITTPFSFFATTEAILRLGATPVFADIDPSTLNIDPSAIDRAVTERTKVILPVHLFGLPADMPRILAVASRHGLPVLEDCAQAFGARCSALHGKRVGTIGTVGAFSFYPTKNLGAYGDAGMVTTQDDQVADRVRSLRNHGSRSGDKYRHDRIGYNSRLDALQAAILSVKLPYVDTWNDGRRRAARAYEQELRNIEGLSTPPLHPNHVFHQYTLRVHDRRPQLEATLRGTGVAHALFYPTTLARQPIGSNFGSVPEAERAAREVLSLPIYPTLGAEVPIRVARAAMRALAPADAP